MLRILGLAGSTSWSDLLTAATLIVGRYVVEYDPSHDLLQTTADFAEARWFADPADAEAYWRQSSGHRRADGELDRPLTAFTVSFDRKPKESEEDVAALVPALRSAGPTPKDTEPEPPRLNPLTRIALERELRCAEAGPRGYDHGDERRYLDGYVAALRWALNGGRSPITNHERPAPPSPEMWGQEMMVGDAVICRRRPSVPDQDRDFVIGAENALSWACLGTMPAMFDGEPDA